MEFADLNNEIAVEGWLIPRQDIAKRRLIKQTPRYKMYQADCFGDVMLYEPSIKNKNISARRRLRSSITTRSQISLSGYQELNLNIDYNTIFQPASSPSNSSPISPAISLCSETSSLESGYSSSASTTPHHFSTEQSSKLEFEFPSCSGFRQWNSRSELERADTRVLDLENIARNNNKNFGATQDERSKEEPGNGSKSKYPQTTFPVVLNRDSFRFGPHSSVNESNYFSRTVASRVAACNYAKVKASDEDSVDSEFDYMDDDSSGGFSWSELNELRLIAHENFMLFRGFCIEQVSLSGCANNQSTALVMDLCHPKAVSLYNLLHANNQAIPFSPSDR